MIDVEMLRPTADEMLSGLRANDTMKQRILFMANAAERIPEAAADMLGGLRATPALRHRILVAAEGRRRGQRQAAAPAHHRPALARFTPAVGMALVLALMIGIGVNYASAPQLVVPGPQTELGTGMAGDGNTASGTVPQFHPLYVGEGANPPLVGVHGRYYRMLDVPVSQSAVGTPIGEVQEFTEEPSLAGTVGVVSNVVQAGGQVYAVDGLSTKTACIAEVDGVLRLFQRVGYASGGVVGTELFEDTLDVYGQVTAIELSGVGVITDEAKANELVYCLYEFAVFSGNDLSGGNQAITVYLRNGLSLQLMVNGDIISGCGAWACPEFFSDFEMALAEQNT